MFIRKIEWNSLFVAISLLCSGLLIVGAGLLVDYSSTIWVRSQALHEAQPATHTAAPAHDRSDMARVPIRPLEIQSSSDERPELRSISVRVN